MDEIHDKVYSKFVFEHVKFKYQQGEQDEDWIPRLPDDDFEYVVITADGGKQSIRGKKLPELCRKYKITHVILSATLSQKTSSEKEAALLQFWYHIAALHDEEPGSRFQLRYVSTKGKGNVDRVTVSLVPVDYDELDRKAAERAAAKQRRKDARGH